MGKILRYFFFAVLLAFAAGVACNLVCPDVARLKQGQPGPTAFMKYRQAQALKSGKRSAISQRWVALSSISPYLVQAVVISEDDKFWTHHGFDFEAMKTAVKRDIREKTFLFGGSTITQQLAKNLYLSPSKSPLRKFREFILAWRLERTLGKKRILELYLNVVEWGNGIFGAEAAAQHFYGKPAADLTAEEAVHLAVVLPSPRRYDPLSGSTYIESRAREILEIMAKRGGVSQEEAEK